MKTLSDKLFNFFKNAEKLHLVHHASSQSEITPNISNQDLVSYLTPIHPHPIHIVSNNELSYLQTLNDIEIKTLLTQLSNNEAKYLIFENQKNIPSIFFEQTLIHLVVNEPQTNNPQQLSNEINEHVIEHISQHGAFVVVFNKGILITGESGSGKSSLLINLIKQGHLWVADDLSLFFLDNNHHKPAVIGQASGELSEFIHIKGLGPINVDKSHGQACRIHSHPLAAVIHLSNNSTNENKNLSAYTQLDTFEIFDKKFPLWHFSSNQPNLSTLVENCAKNLILNDWDCNAADGLKNALKNALTANTTDIKTSANTSVKRKTETKSVSMRPA